jgi:uridine kinase
MHQKFLEPQKQYADFIVGEETDVAASILAAQVNQNLLMPSMAESRSTAFGATNSGL